MTEPNAVAAAVAALVAAIREQVLAEVAAATPKPYPAPDQVDAAGPLLLTLVEARERLRISKATLDRILRQGRLRKVKIGARVFVPAEEISKFIAEASAD
ncbi:helix-turn-helix domain-containing protein [Mycobacteroides abscessus]|uniref:helix-turn-helix domain-containing protein n=1 Tax=Mycobacteroides abscessus TaxID=36809 RepID=UPI001A9667DA|nr:helix-turn-helix domain-containing protein [Mycobacteroides abscessus]